MKLNKIILMMMATSIAVCGCDKTSINNTNETRAMETLVSESTFENSDEEKVISESESNEVQVKMNDEEITEAIIDNFKGLAKVPRPSGHEEKISDYLYNWAKERNIEVTKDSVNNIIMEVPATKGLEHLEKVLLQTHMDMVFVSNDNLDPLTTPVNVVINGDYITSDGRTSLGADDGIGIAIALTIADGKMAHGPIRLLTTVDEENSMYGVNNLNPTLFQDVKYVINIDHEGADDICISSAGLNKYQFEKENEVEKPTFDKALNLKLYGLIGGHSGVEIDKGRVNANICIVNAINTLSQNGIEFELSEYEGGSLMNVIPSATTATICISADDLGNAKELITNYLANLQSENKEIEPDMTFEVEEVELPANVIKKDDSQSIIDFVVNMKNGVYHMSTTMEGLVAASSNVGVVKLSEGKFTAIKSIRSSVMQYMDELCANDEANAKSHNVSFVKTKLADEWPIKEGSRLVEMMSIAYENLYEKKPNIIATHGGLECGTFLKYNKDLDIVAIGPNVKDNHSINENVYIPSLIKIWKIIERVLCEEK